LLWRFNNYLLITPGAVVDLAAGTGKTIRAVFEFGTPVKLLIARMADYIIILNGKTTGHTIYS
jgi:hypothetical protein